MVSLYNPNHSQERIFFYKEEEKTERNKSYYWHLNLQHQKNGSPSTPCVEELFTWSWKWEINFQVSCLKDSF